MRLAELSPTMSCCDDHSDTTATTASTIGSNPVNVCALEAKIMKVMAENSRLRSEVKRQASIAAKAREEMAKTVQLHENRLEALEKMMAGGGQGQVPRARRSHTRPKASTSSERKSCPDLSCHITNTRLAAADSDAKFPLSGGASVVSASSKQSKTRMKSVVKTRNNATAAKAVEEILLLLESDKPEKPKKGSMTAMQMSAMSFGNLDWDFDDTTAQEDDEDQFPILSALLPVTSEFASKEEKTKNTKPSKSNVKTVLSSLPSPASKHREVKREGENSPKYSNKKVAAWTAEKANELCQPFPPEQMAQAQAQDKALTAGRMYPKFCTSFQTIDGSNQPLTLFSKCVYVPKNLRQETMEHYYRTNNGQGWSREMCKHKIWETIDTDITNFKMSKH